MLDFLENYSSKIQNSSFLKYFKHFKHFNLWNIDKINFFIVSLF